MRIAVVGTGISGLVAARLLSRDHEVRVYEAGSYIGGHTNTVDVDHGGRRWAVDTGFIVFNEKTYPNFIALMRELGVGWQNSDMSFSVRSERTGLEYGGESLDTLFAQRRNVLRPSFLRMVRDILRFYREARELLETDDDTLTIGEYLRRGRYSSEFVEHHLMPMAAAVWSASPATMRDFPARYLVQFFENHGFLQVEERPQWLAIQGGSREYVAPLTAPFRDRIHLDTPVVSVRRRAGGVELATRNGRHEAFDKVVLAVHSDQALRMLADPTDDERDVLSGFSYQRNETVLHTDASILPRIRKVRSSWNYVLPREASDVVTVTYWMNRLQALPEDAPDFCVTLNGASGIDPNRIARRITYHHPVYTPAAVRSQKRHDSINGARDVFFCGAYWGYGFHEDGVKSALAVCRHFDQELAA